MNYYRKEYELIPEGRQKSFYGKAKVIDTGTTKYLQSYSTIVCSITDGGIFTKLWTGYSATTAKHIDSFMKLYGFSKFNKKQWEQIPENKPIALF